MKKLLCALILLLPVTLFSQRIQSANPVLTPLYATVDSSEKVITLEYIIKSSIHKEKNLVFALFHRDIITLDKELVSEMNIGMVFDCSDRTTAILYGTKSDSTGKMIDSVSVPSLQKAIWHRENESKLLKIKLDLLCKIESNV